MNTIFTHTPGPWRYTVSGNCDSVLALIDDHGTQLAEIERWNAEPDNTAVIAQAEANAQLIAAAPQLLAALVLAVTALNTAPRFRVPLLTTDSYKIASVCDRAIAQAKGEAQ